jgi:hypothetical protein
VKSIDHIRIVPLINGDRSQLDYMKKFSMDKKVRLLPRCYNEQGEWTATTNEIVKWFDELGIDWRPKATKKHPLNEIQKAINESYPRPVYENGNSTTKIRKRKGCADDDGVTVNNHMYTRLEIESTSSTRKRPHIELEQFI